MTRDDVVRAGVQITAESGLGAISLGAVARRLGLQRPSVYHHVPGGLAELRTSIVEAVAELLAADSASADIAVGAGPTSLADWQRMTLSRVARAARDFPGVLHYLLTVGRDEAVALTESDRLLLVLRGSELRTTAAEAYMIIHAYVTGWVVAQRPSSAAASSAGLDELSTALTAAEQMDQERVLFDGLQALVSGLLRPIPDTL